MAVFDPRLWAISLLMWLFILGVVRELGMLEALILLAVFAAAVVVAAVKLTDGPSDLSRDE